MSLPSSIGPSSAKMPPSSALSAAVLLLLLHSGSLPPSLSQPSFPGCHGTFSCGNLHNLNYPFTGGERPDYCGPPEFRLDCPIGGDGYPEITSDSLAYRVLEANLTRQSLILARSDLWNNTCPNTFVNSSLDSSIFVTSDVENVDLTIFFGCSIPLMSIEPQYRFDCDVGGVEFTDSYFLLGAVPIVPILELIHCFKGLRMPLLRTVADELTGNGLTLAEALTRGFRAVYTDPYNQPCTECRGSGGQCGFNTATLHPICICSSRICSPPGVRRFALLI